MANINLSKLDAYKQGGVINWLLSFQSPGTSGTLSITDTTITWKAMWGLGRGFSCQIADISRISRGKYLNFWVFPTNCLQIVLRNGTTHSFTFKFGGGAKGAEEDAVVAFFRSKGVPVQI